MAQPKSCDLFYWEVPFTEWGCDIITQRVNLDTGSCDWNISVCCFSVSYFILIVSPLISCIFCFTSYFYFPAFFCCLVILSPVSQCQSCPLMFSPVFPCPLSVSWSMFLLGCLVCPIYTASVSRSVTLFQFCFLFFFFQYKSPSLVFVIYLWGHLLSFVKTNSFPFLTLGVYLHLGPAFTASLWHMFIHSYWRLVVHFEHGTSPLHAWARQLWIYS